MYPVVFIISDFSLHAKNAVAGVGTKNWLFFGSERSGKKGVIIFSILQSAKRHGLNEYEYLLDILNRLADLPSEHTLYELLPDH